MNIANRTLLGLLCLLVTGCAGGGGSNHTPPQSIHAGQPTTLTMELTSWGAGFGKLSKRYTEIQCHYRMAGAAPYDVVPMTPTAETKERLTVQGVIPALTAKPGDKLEYYFDMKFDGVYNKRAEQLVPFE